MLNKNKSIKLAIIGLGYVGLPLFLEFSKKRNTLGFDINENRINELKSFIDKNKEFSKDDFLQIPFLNLTNKFEDLSSANCYIITVPTPVDDLKKPDLEPLSKVSKSVGSILKKDDIVIYESTVYPGCIEEECVPILEKFSNLKFNKDFYCGYSPERINPGDKKHIISNIKKITSGSTPLVAEIIDNLYNEIIIVGTHKAPSIKVAEAAKVIENTQRDLNIALINELAILFNKMEIDTEAVLEAAGTKWNFLSFKPGLVGGHCIGVDPYYLTHKAKSIGYNPKVILAGREINESMGLYVASNFVRHMLKKNINIKGSKVLIMGLTFKENCADIRNSGIKDVINELKRFECQIELYDPWANSEEVKASYNMYTINKLIENTYDGIIISVAHSIFKRIGINKIKSLCKKNHIIYDLKHLYSKKDTDLRL